MVSSASKLLFTSTCLLLVVFVPGVAKGAIVVSFDFEEGTDGATATGIDSILDSSGNGLHGTPFGPVYRQFNGSLGLEFDGNDDHVFIADDPLFELSQSMTIEATIQVRALNPNGQNIFFRGDSRPGRDPYQLWLGGDGTLLMRIHDGTQRADVISVSPIPIDEQVHVVGTLNDATDELLLYVNGQVVGKTITTIRPFGQLDPTLMPGLSIGSTAGNSSFFNGFIDDVRIHDTAFAVPEPSLCFPISAAALCLFGCRAWKHRS